MTELKFDLRHLQKLIAKLESYSDEQFQLLCPNDEIICDHSLIEQVEPLVPAVSSEPYEKAWGNHLALCLYRLIKEAKGSTTGFIVSENGSSPFSKPNFPYRPDIHRVFQEYTVSISVSQHSLANRYIAILVLKKILIQNQLKAVDEIESYRVENNISESQYAPTTTLCIPRSSDYPIPHIVDMHMKAGNIGLETYDDKIACYEGHYEPDGLPTYSWHTVPVVRTKPLGPVKAELQSELAVIESKLKEQGSDVDATISCIATAQKDEIKPTEHSKDKEAHELDGPEAKTQNVDVLVNQVEGLHFSGRTAPNNRKPLQAEQKIDDVLLPALDKRQEVEDWLQKHGLKAKQVM